jgi:hypothetical protein
VQNPVLALSLLRYTTVYLPLARLLPLIVQILHERPYYNKKTRMVYQDGRWKKDNPEMVGKVEAQLWLSLTHILCKHNTLEWDQSLQMEVLRVQELLTEKHLVQLPPTQALQHYLIQLALSSPPESLPLKPRIEVVSDMECDWKQCEMNLEEWKDREFVEAISEMFEMNGLEDVVQVPSCSNCREEASQRCSRCQKVWYCGRECQVGDWKRHKTSCKEKLSESRAQIQEITVT